MRKVTGASEATSALLGVISWVEDDKTVKRTVRGRMYLLMLLYAALNLLPASPAPSTPSEVVGRDLNLIAS